jgi:hypothetical protein
MCEKIIEIGGRVYMTCDGVTRPVCGGLPRYILNSAIRRGVEAISGSRSARLQDVKKRVFGSGQETESPQLRRVQEFINWQDEPDRRVSLKERGRARKGGGVRRRNRGRDGSRASPYHGRGPGGIKSAW